MGTNEQGPSSHQPLIPPSPKDLSAEQAGFLRSMEGEPPDGEAIAAWETKKGPSELGRSFYNLRQSLGEKLGCIGWFVLLVAILVAAVFYALKGQPLFPIEVTSPASTTPSGDQVVDFSPEPAFVILGEYDDEVFIYNRGVKRLYAYDRTTQKERKVVSFADFDTFAWHESGKVALISQARNVLGAIYILDLTQAPPESVLITDRESDPGFPRNLRLDSSLPLNWSTSGERIAFVARDIQDNSESLFVYDVTTERLVYTPARNLDRITGAVWVSKGEQLALVIINDGQEGRYSVNWDGGEFCPWEITD